MLMLWSRERLSMVSDLPGHVFDCGRGPARALPVLAQYCVTEIVGEVAFLLIVLLQCHIPRD